MNFANPIGQIIDGKYKIERQLGKGGMGTVYLATHVGTERPVAVKVIVPQFMQRAEFVERFRREARAAGRLRHPNVVDVTDFGISEMPNGRIAYLVMEYLDGCTLGEILEEDKQLPLSWSLDILEQVCSAVHEAHAQGIIHRDLKPDNIWLEPNQRGGYTVKVLDFGIAKLEENSNELPDAEMRPAGGLTQADQIAETIPDLRQTQTIADQRSSTILAESGTLIIKPEAGTIIQSAELPDEKGTAIMSAPENGGEKGTLLMTVEEIESEKGTAIMNSGEIEFEDGTALFPSKQTQIINDDGGTVVVEKAVETDRSKTVNSGTAELTRVGAVLGTPLYMSPEQCRGEKLTPRSDIYSLGVIAYQMLSGKTPFEGDFTSVMQSHKEIEPPQLDASKIPKKVKRVVHSALAKRVEERPPTAEALASQFRAHSEGIGNLLTRAFVIFSERLPLFLKMAFLISIPTLLLTAVTTSFRLLVGIEVLQEDIWTTLFMVVMGIVAFFTQIFTAIFLSAMTVWVVAQILAVPLRPIELRKAFKRVRERSKPLLKTVTVSTILAMIGLVFCLIPGIWLSARYMLIAPSIMMEGISGRTAFRRSIELVKRSYRTVIAAALLAYFVPALLGLMIGLAARGMVEGTMPAAPPPVVQNTDRKDKKDGLSIKVNGEELNLDEEQLSPEEKEWKRTRSIRRALTGAIFEIFWAPLTVIIASFSSIITALIYFKTRQAGGESMKDLLEQFEDADRPKSKWQQRVEDRLIQSGRITSKT